jgi:hypothetical protein
MKTAATSMPPACCFGPAAAPLRMAHFYVPIGVVRRGFFPGEADHVIPEGNLGNVMTSLGKQDPRAMYRRLFSTAEADRFREVTRLVLEDARTLQRQLAVADRQKLDEYFEAIRAIELQMTRLKTMKAELATVRFDEPTEAHLPRGDYIRLMGELMVVALQSGLTNVATFMVGPERWDTPFLYESLFDKPRSHHQMSHDQTKVIDDLLKIDRFHMEQFASLVQRMDDIAEADGTTLLDNTLFTYGSGLGDGSTHQYNDLPIVVAGGGCRVKGGLHINMPEGTPLANLWLTQAQVLGLPWDSFADSSGGIDAWVA